MAETSSTIALNPGWQKVSTDGWIWASLQNVSPSQTPIMWCRADALPGADFQGGFTIDYGQLHTITELTGLAVYAKPMRSAAAQLIVDGSA